MSRQADWEERWERRRAKWRRKQAAELRRLAAERQREDADLKELERKRLAGELPPIPLRLVVGWAVWLFVVFGGFLR